MSDVTRPAGSFRRGLSTVMTVVGCVVAVAGSLVAAVPALGGLEWGSDSGPFPVVVSVPPALISVAALHLVSRRRSGSYRPTLGLVLGLLGLLVWAAALVVAFRSQSSYTSSAEDAGVPTPWIVAGGLGALVAVASSALLPARVRLRGLLVAAGLVAVLWLVPGVVRVFSNVAPTLWGA